MNEGDTLQKGFMKLIHYVENSHTPSQYFYLM